MKKSVLFLIAVAFLIMMGCEKQPVYENEDWQGTWKSNAWEMVINDNVTITDNASPLVIVDHSMKRDNMQVTAEQTLSGTLYLYEFECTLVAEKGDVPTRYIEVELTVYRGSEYYGEAEFTMNEVSNL